MVFTATSCYGDPNGMEVGEGMEDSMKRKGSGQVKGIRTPLDRLRDNMKDAWLDFVRQARSVLAGVMLAWLLYWMMRLIGG